ncbi:MAG: alanine racemase [Acidobacteriota bacterium]
MGGFENHLPGSWAEDEQIGDLPTPALVLDLDVLERNLKRMALRMRKLKVAMRPHFKTHKSLGVARIQRELQCIGFTASTLGEVRTLAEAGFHDVLWAFPVILNRIPELVTLAGDQPDLDLQLVVDSPDAVTALETEWAPRVSDPAVWLKVDCGYHRAGVDPTSDRAIELVRRLRDSPALDFAGILSHSGHAYAHGRDAIRAAAEEERRTMVTFARKLRDLDLDVPRVSIGSTPAMAVADDLGGITEVRPGNYVFYDYSQVSIGSCTVADCALTVLASVVSCQPGASHCVIDAGALSLSKDPGPPWIDPPTFGEVFGDYGAGELAPDVRVSSLSQEHGIVNAPLPVGTRLRILPNHACLTVPNFERYAIVRGQRVVDVGAVSHRPHGPYVSDR